MLRIEYALGRVRDIHLGPRTIDLDLLMYRDEQRQTEYLRLPHPRLHQRRFVLEPLNELVPNLVHPVLGQTVNDLLNQLEDPSTVRLWKPV
jgi:2-amino-4-hydroxy-6-hydroxymethyldihydropteridine diphosphokinase